MSLILDALNKADRENRQPDTSPTLDTEHDLPDSDDLEESSKHKLIFSVVFIAIVLGASIFWLLNNSGNTRVEQNNQGLASNESSHDQDKQNRTTASGTATPNSNSKPEGVKKPAEAKSVGKNQIDNEKKLSRSEELKKRYIQAQYEEQKKRVSGSKSSTSTTLTQTVNQNSAASSNENTANNSTTKNRQISGLYQKTDALQNVSSPETTGQIKTAEKSRSESSDSSSDIDELMAANAGNDVRNNVNSNKKAGTTDRDIELAIREFQNAEKPQISKGNNASEDSKPEASDDTLMAFYTDIGSIRDLPFSAQEKIPSIMYSNHQYSGSRKSVEMNGKQYRENSKVSSDLTIEKILKDGVILRYKNHKFKMSAYNNWINL